jgi:hypothetical protein
MVGEFVLAGRMVKSNNGRSFKIFTFTEDGRSIFVGLISRENLGMLARGERVEIAIYRYVSMPRTEKVTKELDFSVKLADPGKLDGSVINP